MANVDRPNGFRPYKTLAGDNWNGSFVKCYAAADCFMGDAVIMETTGVDNGGAGYQTVVRAPNLATAIVYGVVVGWEPNPSNLDKLYHVGSASTYAVYVCIDPDMTYLVQDDGEGTHALSHLDVGSNIDGVVAAGSTSTGLSNMEVDASVTGITGVAQMHLVSIPPLVGNVIATAYCDYQILFDISTYHNGGAIRVTGV
jgi:hypothetical protein